MKPNRRGLVNREEVRLNGSSEVAEYSSECVKATGSTRRPARQRASDRELVVRRCQVVRCGAAAAGVTATAQHNSPAAPHDLRLSAQPPRIAQV